MICVEGFSSDEDITEMDGVRLVHVATNAVGASATNVVGMKLIKNVGFMLAFLPAAQALGRWHH